VADPSRALAALGKMHQIMYPSSAKTENRPILMKKTSKTASHDRLDGPSHRMMLDMM
jgi:hypothetical protein